MIVDKDDEPRIMLGTFPDGAASVNLHKAGDKVRPVAVIAVNREGNGDLHLWNKEGGETFHAPQ